MPRTFDYQITIANASEVAGDLRAIGKRMENAEPAFRAIIPVIESGEERYFSRLKGRYVRTGATKDSLTGVTANSIRDVHNDGGGLTFGTTVSYAKFLTKRRRDPQEGRLKKKGRPGWSAVLVLTRTTRKQINKVIADWVMGRGAFGSGNTFSGGGLGS